MPADRDSLARHRAYSLLIIAMLAFDTATFWLFLLGSTPGPMLATAAIAVVAMVAAFCVRPRRGDRR